jgi:hypothetical protein
MNKLFCITILVIIVVAFSACQGVEPPSQEEIFAKRIEGDWKVTNGTITKDGRDVTGSFPGLEITFNASRSYEVANPVSPVWPVSGSYNLEYVNGDIFNIRRDDGVLLVISELTDTSIKFSFPYTSPNGRVKDVSGEFTFNMHR